MSAAYPLLLIDAGNSRVKWAWVSLDGQRRSGGPFDRHLNQDGETELLDAWQQLPVPKAIWISNVAGPGVAARVAALLDRQWPHVPRTTIMARDAQCGVVNRYREPSKLGSDRWAGMIAAHAAYPGEALLIATLGTATTLDALNAEGHFVGGMIAPGWSLMMRSLGEHTAQLPTMTPSAAGHLLHDADAAGSAMTASSTLRHNEDGENAVRDDTPPRHFAQDTASALAEGCRLAQVGLISAAWKTLSATTVLPVRCIVSGGAAPEVVRALDMPFTRRDDLVLEGLALIAATNA